MCILDKSIKELAAYIDIDRMLNTTGVVPFWIKDIDFRFLRYNKAMIDILYPGAGINDLLGKTDWEYLKAIGKSDKEVQYCKESCMISDLDMLKTEAASQKYFELVTPAKNKSFWLLTTKVRIPPEVVKEKAKGIYGTAVIFPGASKIIKSGVINLKPLTETCYRILE